LNRAIRITQFAVGALLSFGLLDAVEERAWATDRHVTSSADSGVGSLRDQVGAAAPGDTVIIDPGVNPTLTGGIFIQESITIQGQGPAATTVTGGLGTVFVVRRPPFSSTPVVATIAGVRVTGGHWPAPTISDGSPGPPAGGILVDTGETLTINSSTITGNSAGNGATGGTGSNGSNGGAGGPGGGGGAGGGVFNGGTLTINNSTISGNSSGRGGNGGPGGTGSGTFGTGGTGGAGGGGGVGGGVASIGLLTINSSTIVANNTATPQAGEGGDGGLGGAGAFIGADGGVGGPGGAGGGLAVFAGTVTVTNSTIEGNKAGDGGTGGVGPFGSTGGPGGNGGGFASTTWGTVSSTTIANNAAGSGGGGSGVGGPGPGGAGGGVSGAADPNQTTLQNSLLALNTSPGGGPNCAGPVVDGGHNLAFPADAVCPAGFLSGDPLIGSLGANGGPTQTMALGAGSAALDQVPASGAGCPANDQRGIGRPQGAACDIGAFERQSDPPPTAGVQGPVTSFNLAAAIRKCKKKFRKGPKRKRCIKRARQKAAAQRT
jgi:hypothetical protein